MKAFLINSCFVSVWFAAFFVLGTSFGGGAAFAFIVATFLVLLSYLFTILMTGDW
jgi:hypothetical protein